MGPISVDDRTLVALISKSGDRHHKRARQLFNYFEKAMNKEEKKAYNKAYHQDNLEEIKIQRKAYHEDHKEARTAYDKAYYQANTEQQKARNKAWREANPDKNRAYAHTRRALEYKTPYEHINEKEVYLRDGWICQHCKKKVDKKFSWPHPMCASLDHIIPLNKGGSHIYSNIQLTHLICNLSKNDGVLPQGEQMRIF